MIQVYEIFFSAWRHKKDYYNLIECANLNQSKMKIKKLYGRISYLRFRILEAIVFNIISFFLISS